ncbi:C40 family peptidase [Paenibacillus sp. y28]
MLVQAGSAYAETPLNEAVNEMMGTPYKWAGTNEDGFDCSGFTMFIFAKFGIDLPHQSASQYTKGYWIKKDELREGDLVFFDTSTNTGKSISHVGVYVGNNEFAHSATNKGIIKTNLSDAYYAKRYVGARRILWDDLYTQLTTEPQTTAAAK